MSCPRFALLAASPALARDVTDSHGNRIFYFTYDNGDGKGTSLEEHVLADPLWQSLSAVDAGKVHRVSDAIWNTAGGILAAKLMLQDIAGIYALD